MSPDNDCILDLAPENHSKIAAICSKHFCLITYDDVMELLDQLKKENVYRIKYGEFIEKLKPIVEHNITNECVGLSQKGLLEISVNENGEPIFWMNETQKVAAQILIENYRKKLTNDDNVV